jgi:L-fuconolactonase
MRIDAHQHFWQLSRAECRWPTPDLAPIYRDSMPADLRPLMDECGITHSIVVQSQEDERDTEWLLGIAAKHDWIAGVVGWVDLAAPDVERRIARLKAAHPKLVGVRPMLQSLADPKWILRPEVEAGLLALAKHSLCFDALIRPEQLPVIAELARRHPELKLVLDHAGKPAIASGAMDPWRADLASVAESPSVYCKLSGLVTEAAEQWQAGELVPYLRHVLKYFGPKRLMWGSDWPVVNIAGSYGDWHRTASELVSGDPHALAEIFGGTAEIFYGIF